MVQYRDRDKDMSHIIQFLDPMFGSNVMLCKMVNVKWNKDQ